jgi:hypothetical protein
MPKQKRLRIIPLLRRETYSAFSKRTGLKINTRNKKVPRAKIPNPPDPNE